MRFVIHVAVAMLLGSSAEAWAQRPGESQSTPVQRFFDWSSLQFPQEEYAGRRQAMMAQLRASGGGVYLVPSSHGVSQGNTFRQYRDFLYFTGLEVPASLLALDADSGTTTLFAPAEDWRFANPSRRNDFPGRPLADDPSLSRVSGISRIYRFTEFDPYLRRLVAGGRVLRLSADYRGPLRPLETPPTRPWNANPALRLHIERAHPDAEIRNAYEQLARLRMVKSPLEVAVMRRAAEVTARAILEDEILITASGAEVLTGSLPRPPEALEKIVAP